MVYPAEKSVFLSGFVQGQGQKTNKNMKERKLSSFITSLHVLTMDQLSRYIESCDKPRKQRKLYKDKMTTNLRARPSSLVSPAF